MATTFVRPARQLVARSKNYFLLSRNHVFRPRLISSASRKKTQVSLEREELPNPYISARASLPGKFTTSESGRERLSSLYHQSTTSQENVDVRSSGTSPQGLDPLQHILDHPSASIILRDACKCSRCKDPETSQRNFNLAQIPVNIGPAQARQDSQNNWVIRWQNDIPGWEEHESTFTPRQIERLESHMQKEHITNIQLWNKETIQNSRFSVTYNDYMNSDAALAKTLYYFGRHGIVFIKNVPEDELAVNRLARRVSFMKSTFYGETWDIQSLPNAKNVAFTNKYLGFHSDLVYMKEPPTGQFLHCLHNSAKGGESRFVDQFRAFDTMLTEDRDLAFALASTRLRYEYENDGFYYSDIKPIVQFQDETHRFPRRRFSGVQNQELLSVYRMFWAPQFLGSIMPDIGIGKADLEKSIAAMRKYTEILERDDMVFEEKMQPGNIVFFDNLRVLHARNEFDPTTGKRWLRGTYLDGQDMWSVELKLKNYMAQFQTDELASTRM